MKSTVIVTIVLVVFLFSGVSAAGPLPSEFSYTILKEGKQIGTSATQVESGKKTVVFTTNTQLEFDQFELDLNTRTEVDSKTFVVQKITYDGIRMGKIIEGEYVIDDLILHEITAEGAIFDYGDTRFHYNVVSGWQ